MKRIPLWLLATTAAATTSFAAKSEGTLLAEEARYAPYPLTSVWWGDYDADGLEDAYVVQPDGSGRLLHNQGDGRFVDVTERAGLADLQGHHLAAWGDADGDGRADLYLAAWRGVSRLYVQLEDGTFADHTQTSGLPAYAQPLDATWRDVDGDGNLDLQLVTELDDLVYRSDGEGRFEKLDLGLAPRVAPPLGTLRPTSVDQARANAGVPAIGGGPSGGRVPTPDYQPICAHFVKDQAVPGVCLMASSDPTLGMLYPISSDWFVESGTGYVGLGTTSPSARLEVAGDVFADQFRSMVGVGPPIVAASTSVCPNLNADLLDGYDSSAFAVLPVTGADIANGSITASDLASNSVGSSELANGVVLDSHVNAAAGIQGTKIDPDFGSLDVTTDGHVGIGTTVPGGPASESDLTIEEAADSTEQAWITLKDEIVGAPGTFVEMVVTAREGAYDVGQVGTRSDHGLFFFTSDSLFMEADNLGNVRMWDDLGVNGDLNVDGIVNADDVTPLSGTLTITGDVVGTSEATFGDGGSSDWEVKGDGGFGPTNGYLGTQGATDFDGVTTADWSGDEIGVVGISTGASDTDNYGVVGHSNGVGVRGEFSGSPTTNYCELGSSAYGAMAVGSAASVFGDSRGLYDGIRAYSDVQGSYALWARHFNTTGDARAVVGQTSSPTSFGVYASGGFGGSGAKYFINPHPTNPLKEVRMVCLEGNESGTYFRGTSRTVDGLAIIPVPEVFRLVSIDERMTVQLTAVGARAELWVEHRDLNEIVVKSDVDVEFDYFVNGVRRGYEDLGENLIADNISYLPLESGVPFGTQYPESYRQILVENGILNPDFTANEATMALMEQALEHYAIRRQQLTQEAEASAATQFPNVEEPEPEREPLPVKPSTKVPREERPSMTRGR